MDYQVKAKNIRGYLQEELFESYKEALHFAIECKNSELYSVITINEFCSKNNNFFLKRIIK